MLIRLSQPTLSQREKDLVNEVLDSGLLVQGLKVRDLEESFARYCGTQFAIAVNNGTAALHTALAVAEIGVGDEVITTPFTFVATANSILMQGAKVVFADIEKETFNIDPEEVERKITAKTKAILAVDLYGHPADYLKLRELTKKHNLILIEDAAQAHGAECCGVRTGNLADISCFSLYATKNMMCAEGGIITTNNEKFSELSRRFRHHGQSETRYEYNDLGYNYRLTDIQAAIAIGQLEMLEKYTQRRIHNAKLYSNLLNGVQGIATPVTKSEVKHVFHQYTITCDNLSVKRDNLRDYLKKQQIESGVYYAKPLHLHSHFRKFGYQVGDFLVSENIANRVLSLPVHPLISDRDIETICTHICNFSKGLD